MRERKREKERDWEREKGKEKFFPWVVYVGTYACACGCLSMWRSEVNFLVSLLLSTFFFRDKVSNFINFTSVCVCVHMKCHNTWGHKRHSIGVCYGTECYGTDEEVGGQLLGYSSQLPSCRSQGCWQAPLPTAISEAQRQDLLLNL